MRSIFFFSPAKWQCLHSLFAQSNCQSTRLTCGQKETVVELESHEWLGHVAEERFERCRQHVDGVAVQVYPLGICIADKGKKKNKKQAFYAGLN